MRSSLPELLCKNGVLANFAKFTRKYQKDIPLQMFSCEFCEISHNTFFKDPFGPLFLHKHPLCLLSYHDLSPFQKRCHTYFLAEYFFGLICRLETKISSIFKSLSQKPIFNPVKHLGWSFSCENSWHFKTVRYFHKRSSIVDVQPGSKCTSLSSH